MKTTFTKGLKFDARCALQKKHASLALITALLTVINLLMNYLSALIAPYSSGFFNMLLYFACSVLINIVYYLLLAGLYSIYLKICCGNSFRWTDLFSAFREHPEPVAIYSILRFVITFIFTEICIWWLSCLISVIMYGMYSGMITSSIIFIIALAAYVFILISFSQFLFIRAEKPWESFTEMISGSWNLMKGIRLRYVYLKISFIGIYLLALLSFGIGTLFTDPYIYTTEGYFYKKISG